MIRRRRERSQTSTGDGGKDNHDILHNDVKQEANKRNNVTANAEMKKQLKYMYHQKRLTDNKIFRNIYITNYIFILLYHSIRKDKSHLESK